MKVTLTYLKDTPKTSAGGKPYISRSIKTQEHGDKWLSGFGNANNKGWKVGDQVEIEVKEVQKDGKTYLNFEVPKPEDKNAAKIEQILNYLVAIKIELAIIKDAVQPRKKGYPTAESEGIDTSKAFPGDEEQEEPTDEDLAAMGF